MQKSKTALMWSPLNNSHKGIRAIVPQGSVLGALLYNAYAVDTAFLNVRDTATETSELMETQLDILAA